MFPFTPFFRPFGFGLPFFGRNRRCRLQTLMGIPVLRTTGVSASDTGVSYTINEAEFFSLPCEGVFFLDVRQSSPVASAALPISLNDGEGLTEEQSLLRNGLQEAVPASELNINGRYLIYYNRKSNSYQLINAYPTATAGDGA